MRKLLLSIVAVLFVAVSSAFAQEQKWAIGLNFGYGTDVEKPFIGVRGQYGINEAFDIAANFNYYFKETYEEYGSSVDLKCWDINADLHWNVLHGENYRLYPLAGLTYMRAKASADGEGVTVSASDGEFGVNLGVGGAYDISSNFAIGVELKYQIIEGGQFVPLATVMYRF